MVDVPLDRLLRNVRQGYQKADEAMQKKIQKGRLKVSCSRGCGGCCYQLVSLSFIEALLIAEFIVRLWPVEKVDQVLASLDDTADLMVADRERYFLERRLCAFFVKGEQPYEGECGIYRVRPLTCRTHFVVSDPVLCRPEHSYECAIVDSRDVSLQILHAISGGSSTLASMGSMQLMVAEAIRCMRENRQPSVFVLETARRRAQAALAHDRAMMERLGLRDHYIDDQDEA